MEPGREITTHTDTPADQLADSRHARRGERGTTRRGEGEIYQARGATHVSFTILPSMVGAWGVLWIYMQRIGSGRDPD